jgi:16S rRNA (guanine(527)-N(7))-methyltransferase RsmG
MQPAHIAELLDPFLGASPCHSERAKAGDEPAVISPTQLQNISTYIDLLLRWNARINLTAIRDPEEIVTRHFGESLFAARHLFPRENREGRGFSCEPALSEHSESKGANVRSPGKDASASEARFANETREMGERAALHGRVQEHKEEGALAPEVTVADIGSGAGFPGIPIKLWAPDISLTLIESNHKKSAFLREVTRALTLTDVNILNARAETLTGVKFDLVILRAVERFETILPVTARLISPNGRLALLVGSAQIESVHTCLPKLSWSEPQPIPLAHSRILTVGHSQR